MKKTVALLILAVMAVSLFAGCSSDPSGTYVTKTINGKTPMDYLNQSDDAETTMALLSLLGITETDFNEKMMSIVLDKDGTAKITSILGDNETGTWTQEGSVIKIKVGDDVREYTLSGKQLTGKFEQADIVLVKK